MTRINLVHPSILIDQHLMGELNEITRIPNGIIDGKLKPLKESIPSFRLGGGHVKFFQDKLHFLHLRYNELRSEYKNRYGKIYPHTWKLLRTEHPELWGRFAPSENDIETSFERTMDMIPKRPLLKSKPITSDFYCLRRMVIDRFRDELTPFRPFMMTTAWEFNGRTIKTESATDAIHYVTVVEDEKSRNFIQRLVDGTGMTKFDLTDPECIGKLAVYFI